VLAFLGRMFAETGLELKDLTLHHVLADDSHAAVLLEATMTLGDRSHTSQYADVYRLRDGKATAHWHLPLDPQAEKQFFAG
jgi:predicted SnoaL-like aldol condensation-catalyzing enzyme